MTFVAGHAVGRLRITEHTGAMVERELSDDDCQELAAGLAFVMALAIDPNASPRPPRSFGAMPNSNEIGKRPPGTASPERMTQSERTLGGHMQLQRRSLRLVRSPATPEWNKSLLLAEFSILGLVQRPILGAGLVASVSPGRSYWLSPDFQLGLVAASTAGDSVNGQGTPVGARLWWLLGRMLACPLRAGLIPERLDLRLCAGFDIGMLSTAGRNVNVPNATRDWWLAEHTAIRLVWNVNRTWSLETLGGVLLPMTRWTLTYNDRVSGKTHDLFALPAYGINLGLNMGYRWM